MASAFQMKAAMRAVHWGTFRPFNASQFDIHEQEKKGRHFGYAQMTLYYVPQ
jgi:hypothetical protein